MKEYSKLRHIWRTLYSVIAFFGIQLATYIVAIIFVVIYYSFNMEKPDAMNASTKLVEENMLWILLFTFVATLAKQGEIA